MRALLLLGVLAGCVPPPPVTVVQVPGMTPLPLARRSLLTVYDRDQFVRECPSQLTGPLTSQAKTLMCACTIDTLAVYVTAAEGQAHVQKYGNTTAGSERAMQDQSPMSRVILACRDNVLGQ